MTIDDWPSSSVVNSFETESGTLNLPPGWHEIQAEGWKGEEQVVACRRLVDVPPGGHCALRVVMVPVIAHPDTVPATGPIGPGGPDGPAGPPHRPGLTSDDVEAIAKVLALDLTQRLRGMKHEIASIRELCAPPFYLHDPDDRATVGLTGPAGPVGRSGPPGADPDVSRLQDYRGQPLQSAILAAAAERLGATDVEERLAALEGFPRLPVAPGRLDEWRIKMRTPELIRALDDEDAPAGAYHTVTGRRGLAGVVGAMVGAPAIRLNPEIAQRIVDLLVADTELQEAVNKLEAPLEDAELWVAERKRRAAIAAGAGPDHGE